MLQVVRHRLAPNTANAQLPSTCSSVCRATSRHGDPPYGVVLVERKGTTVWIVNQFCEFDCGHTMGFPQPAKIGRMTTPPELRRVFPWPGEPVTVRSAYTAERTPRPDRPWLGLSMVTSLDGSIAVEGASGGLGNSNDLDVLLTLRSMADMILVGAGTVRAEGYGPPRQQGQRVGVVTNRADVDLDSDLFAGGAGFVITNEAATIDESRVEVLRSGSERVDIGGAVRRLREIDPNVTYVQAEGGAGLNGSLLDADVIDELDLSISPHLVGGSGPRVTSGAGEELRRFELAHLLSDTDGFVFSRWTRAC